MFNLWRMPAENRDEEQEIASSPMSPAIEIMARLSMSMGLSLARVFLHTSNPLKKDDDVDDEHERLTGYSVAEITESLFNYANSALTRIGLGHDHHVVTGQSLGVILRLLTQFTGPVVGLNDGDVYYGLKAFIYAQTLSKEPEVVPPTAEKPNIAEMQRYMRFIMACYGALGMKFMGILPLLRDKNVMDNNKAITYLTGVETEGNLLDSNWRANWTGSIFHPGYYILLDHSHKELIVGIRGSFRFQDAVTDLMCEDEEFKFVYHKGEDLETAMANLGKIATKAKQSLEEISTQGGDLSINELKASLKTATKESFEKLKGWATESQKMLKENLEGADLHRLDSTPVDHRKIRGRSHKGFVIATNHLRREIEPTVLEALDEYPDYQVVVCGHSLGAAVSTLLTLMWAKEPKLKNAKCYAVAQPCTVSLDIAESPVAKKRITSITLCDDVVARLSYAAVKDMRDAIVRLAQDDAPPEYDEEGNNKNAKMSLAKWIIKNAESKPKGECRGLFQPVMETLRRETMTNEKLYPAGVLWHVIDDKKGINGGAVLKRPTEFAEIEIGPTMFLYHVPNFYAHTVDPNLPLPETQQAEGNLDAAIQRHLTRMATKHT